MSVLCDVHLLDRRSEMITIFHDKRLYPSRKAAIDNWLDGECACDCNRQLAIWKSTHPGVSMPIEQQLPCELSDHIIVVTDLTIWEAV